MGRVKTHNEFINEMEKKHPFLKILGKYESKFSVLKYHCQVCNYEWEDKADNIRRAKIACPKCGGRIPMSETEFCNKLLLLNKFVTLTEYNCPTTKSKFTCNICGQSFEREPYRFEKSEGCKDCNAKAVGKRMRKSDSKFKKEAREKNHYVDVIGKYEYSKKQVMVRCKNCNLEFLMWPDSILNDHGHYQCRNNAAVVNRTTKLSEFLVDFKSICCQNSWNYEYKGKFVNMDTLAEFYCNDCKSSWQQKPYLVLQGHGCPSCSHSSTSFSEQFIFYYLKYLLKDKEVLNRDRSLISNELDIVIPSYKLAIEFGSWFWHKNRVENDLNKKFLCDDVGYKLITIFDSWDDTQQNILNIFTDLFLYDYDLGSEQGYNTLKLLCNYIKDKFLNISQTNINWKIIEQEARKHSRRKTTEQFSKELEFIHPGYIVAGDYKGNKNHIPVICPKGHRLKKCTPNRLLKLSFKCPECNKENRNPRMLSNEEFLERLSNIHQNIVCLEEYQGMNNPIKFYCKICNKPLKKRKTPASILNQDIGCQRCARKLAGIKNSKSVMCIETGIIYNSIQEASEDTGINTGTISKLCRNISNTKFDIHFKYV